MSKGSCSEFMTALIPLPNASPICPAVASGGGTELNNWSVRADATWLT